MRKSRQRNSTRYSSQIAKASLAFAACLSCLAALSCGKGTNSPGLAAPSSASAISPTEASPKSESDNPYFPAPKGALPVIIVPGIAGTELAQGGRPEGAELLWPPFDSGSKEAQRVRDFAGILDLTNKAMGRLERLSLDGPQTQGAIEPLRAAPALLPFSKRIGSGDAYRPLFEALARARGSDNVYFFGYDWRRDNRATAAELERYIAAVKAERGVARVDIVAHSMGGLVTSAYLARPRSSASVRRVVLVGSPLRGAGEAFRSLSATSAAGGTILGSGSSMLLPGAMGELAAAEDTSVRELAQGLELQMRDLMSAYPAVYELLRPADLGRLGQIGLPDSAPSRRAAAQAMGEAALYRSSVAERLPSIYRGVDLFLVVGEGRRTLEAKDGYVDGDGLVSVESATAGGLFASRARRFALGHVELVQDRVALEYIAGIGER